MKVIIANELNEDIKMEMSKIFVDGFYQWLHFFSKDKGKLTRAFRHMFNLDVFYVAVIDGEVAGLAACTDSRIPSVRLVKKEFKKHLGWIVGTIAYSVLRREFEEKKYPFEITKGMGTVEFVATSAEYRGKGVASSIISNIFEATPYNEYVLEVADTNEKAVRLYEKLGFFEFMRVKMKQSKQSGINNLLYLKYLKP